MQDSALDYVLLPQQRASDDPAPLNPLLSMAVTKDCTQKVWQLYKLLALWFDMNKSSFKAFVRGNYWLMF
jgi:hypothetical protein